jgi:uncharacterized membrane protein
VADLIPPKQEGSSAAPSNNTEGFARTDTARVEAFSDGVMAISITLLALEIRAPDHAPGQLLYALANQWPVYVGYLSSFAYIGVIWLNHHQAFTRIKTVDRGLHAANLTLLFTTASLSSPTAIVSEAVQADLTGPDARAAVMIYAAVAGAMCASWLWIYSHLNRHPVLLSPRTEPNYVRDGRVRSLAGVLVYLVAGVLGYLVHPVIALIVFLLLPMYYFATSEGLHPGPRSRNKQRA